jgi:hypothetical protein
VLEVAHNSALGHFSDREHVADGELSLLTAIDKLASVHALSSNEKLLLQTVLVNIPELDNCERCSTTRIVDDLLDHTLHIAIALSKIQSTELSSTLPVLGVGLENRPTTSTASTNNTTLQYRTIFTHQIYNILIVQKQNHYSICSYQHSIGFMGHSSLWRNNPPCLVLKKKKKLAVRLGI